MIGHDANECTCTEAVEIGGEVVRDPACPVPHEQPPAPSKTEMETWCDSMEATIAWLRQHPEWDAPYSDEVCIFPLYKDVLANMVREAGGCAKTYSSDGFECVWPVSNGFKVSAYINRDKVCRKVEVGETRVVVPAQEAQPERVECRKQYKWVCDEPLLAATREE